MFKYVLFVKYMHETPEHFSMTTLTWWRSFRWLSLQRPLACRLTRLICTIGKRCQNPTLSTLLVRQGGLL